MTADRIKSLRVAKGWTQADLARKLGMTRNGVNSWEQGFSMPSPALLVELSKVFSVSTDYLLCSEAHLTLDVSGLSDHAVSILSQVADFFRECEK